MLLDLYFVDMECIHRWFVFGINTCGIIVEFFHLGVDLFLYLRHGDIHGADAFALAAFHTATREVNRVDHVEHGLFGKGHLLGNPVRVPCLGNTTVLTDAHGACVAAGIAADTF